MESRSSAHAGSSSTTTMAILPRRNSVSSLTPAKERQMLDRMQPYSKNNGTTNSALRPPLMHNGNSSSSSLHNANKTKSNGSKTTTTTTTTKSSNLASGGRPPTKPPPLPRRSVAVSQEETCFVSAAGDVLVCRSREFSQLMGNSSNQDASSKNSPNTNAMKCFDIECSEFPAMALEKSSLCNPWLTASTSREEKKEDDRGPNRQFIVRAASSSSGMHGGGGSTYEWGVSNNNSKSNRSLNAGGNSSNPVEETAKALGQLELEVANSTSMIESPTGTPREAPLTDDEADDDNVLSMPSFDYSHFGNGGNDMLPTSPVRSRSRRQVDSTENDINLSLKLPQQQSGARKRQPPRSLSSDLPATNPNLSTGPPTHPDVSASPFFHGVPTFLNSLSQVRIKQVSAHPRGSHVLMISAEALLFSYGLNDHGQLGIGIKSPPARKGTESHQRYVWTPTIITPLLENGGKAITCAAGESHSLVVVSTEGRRVLKSQSPRNDNRSRQDSAADTPVMIEMNRVSSSPATMDTRTADHHGDESEHSSSASSSAAAESVWHHQLYGFGRNNYMKIGLVHPQRKVVPESSTKQTLSASHHSSIEETQDEMEDVLLPHRVALHCTVWPEKTSRDETNSTMRAPKLPAQGIFALSASSEHSAAIVRRATGDVEFYTWGNAAYHALGLKLNKTSKAGLAKIVPVPTLVEQLSHSTKADKSSPTNRLLEQNPPEFPVDVALGPYSSFVVTSRGRCLSFGLSYDGMLGHGKIMTEVREPTPIQFPFDGTADAECSISAVSAGTGHVLAIANSGTVYTWGKNTDGRLGLGDSPFVDEEDGVTDLERAIEWTPKMLPPLTSLLAPSRLPPASSARDLVRKPAESEYGPIVQVCAGLDCSIFVTACGKTLSCGKHSGRLGLGEVNTDTNTPTQLFGGLSLWHRPAPMRMPRRNSSASPSPARNRKMLKRGLTTG